VQLHSFLKKVRSLPPDQQSSKIQDLRNAILGSFPERIRDLSMALSASPFTEKDIPLDIRSEWVGISGTRRINIVPRDNPENDRKISAWIQEARTVDPDVTGYAVLIMEGGKAVLRAFREAFGASLAAIVIILLVMMPRKRDALIIFCSLILAGLLTGGLMVFSGIDLNFANIIALPLILGIGVDNGIHIVHRYRKAIRKPVTILQTSTARSIFFSTLTTICSFGNLAVSPHLGMASMGKLLTIGVSMALVTAILIIPAFLTADSRNIDRDR
jgi:predicted RND superfamily exporter protein